MIKIIFALLILLAVNQNSNSIEHLPPILSGEVILVSDFNNRISYLQNEYTNKGFPVTLPLISSNSIKKEDLNKVIQEINSLNIQALTLPLISTNQIISASFINNIFNTLNNVKLICSTNTDCYSVSSQHNQAIYNGELLAIQNNFLYSDSRNQYLGTKCESWYDPSEIEWVDRKLEATKSNYINVNFTSPADHLNHIVYNAPAATCGSLSYSGNQYCRTYGYPYLEVAGVVYMSSSVFGNGGCWSGSGTVDFEKGDNIVIGSHWGSNVQVYSGY